ncbi:MAG TPA: hypothetical protein PKW69_11405 [Niabella sp.]|nr:hypothetical protein [Niabella sp.]
MTEIFKIFSVDVAEAKKLKHRKTNLIRMILKNSSSALKDNWSISLILRQRFLMPHL